MTKWSWKGPWVRLAASYIPAAFCFIVTGFAQIAHQHHPPQSTDEYAKVLEDPTRDEWQKPHEVIMALKLKPSDVVADIGSGTGYFARRFALHAAKVYAVDIDAGLLAISAKSAPPNLTTVLSKPDDPVLAPSSVDVIFFCDVLHHVENRAAYFQHLKRALKPGGRIVTVDFYKKELPVGPPPEMKLAEDALIAEFQASGFKLSRRETFLPYQYFLEFVQAKP
jgi:arsenite methyltransferase